MRNFGLFVWKPGNIGETSGRGIYGHSLGLR